MSESSDTSETSDAPDTADPSDAFGTVTLVEQVLDTGTTALLARSRIRVPGSVPLTMTRKHLPGGPTRPAVMLVHGFAQNRYSWHTSKRSLSGWLASQGWDTWNLELRGHGHSRDGDSMGAERFSDYVDDVLLAAKSLPDRAFWVGHSLGAAALYGAATVEPKSTRGVVGIGGLYHFGRSNGVLNALGHATHALSQAPWFPRLQVRTRLLGKIMGRLYGLSDVLGYTFPVSGWWPGSVEPDLLAERLERGFDWTSAQVWQEMCRWAVEGRFDYEDAWKATDVPLAVMLGDKDHLQPPADGRVAFDHSGSSDKTLKIFDDWENEVHWGHLDLILGTAAPRHVWPWLDAWMAARLP